MKKFLLVLTGEVLTPLRRQVYREISTWRKRRFSSIALKVPMLHKKHLEIYIYYIQGVQKVWKLFHISSDKHRIKNKEKLI